METYYLIDFENVGVHGFSGCDLLGNKDYIVVFYTDQAKKFDLDILNRHNAARLDINKVPPGNQSADMHIVSYLGYLIGTGTEKNVRYVIVSKDTDFDNIIKFWNEKLGTDITRTPVIKDTGSKNTKRTGRKQQSTDKNDSVPVKKADEKLALRKTELRNEIHALLEPQCEEKFIESITEAVIRHYGKKSMLRCIHNDLKEMFNDYDVVYNLIKPAVKDHFTLPLQKNQSLQNEDDVPAAEEENITDPGEMSLSESVRMVLISARNKKDVVEHVTALVERYAGKINGRTLVCTELVDKYGWKRGNGIYNRIKDFL